MFVVRSPKTRKSRKLKVSAFNSILCNKNSRCTRVGFVEHVLQLVSYGSPSTGFAKAIYSLFLFGAFNAVSMRRDDPKN